MKCKTMSMLIPILMPITILGPNFSVSCSVNTTPTDPTVKNIDGSDWEGMSRGNFISDDYIIDEEDQTVTYVKAVGIHAYNLVIPDYVYWKNTPYKVAISDRCFADNQGLAGTIQFNNFIDCVPNQCFFKCTSLTGAIFRKPPIRFGELAFGNCPIFVKICVLLENGEIDTNWSSKVVYIGEYSFYKCWLTGDVTLGPSLQFLGEGAFSGCSHMESLNLEFSESITNISKNLCDSCSALKCVYLPITITSIEENAFRYCRFLQNLIVPSEKMEIDIGASAFYRCELLRGFSKKIKIKSIGPHSFAFNTNLDTEFWENNMDLEEIPSRAFSTCSFSSLVFSTNRLKNVKNEAFSGCSNLCVIDFSNFKPEDGFPSWTGKNIFIDAAEKGTIYISYYADEWLYLFERWGLKISQNHWSIQLTSIPPQIEIKEEPEQKEYSLTMNSGHGELTIGPFAYESTWEIYDEYFVPVFNLVELKEHKPTISTFVTLKPNDKIFYVSLIIDTQPDVSFSVTSSCAIDFYYFGIKILSTESTYIFSISNA